MRRLCFITTEFLYGYNIVFYVLYSCYYWGMAMFCDQLYYVVDGVMLRVYMLGVFSYLICFKSDMKIYEVIPVYPITVNNHEKKQDLNIKIEMLLY